MIRRFQREPQFPRGTCATPQGGRVECLRLRFVGWLAVCSPRSRRQPDGYSAAARASSPRRRVRRLACGFCSANLTPGLRRCRRSPADVTEGNRPKTGRGIDDRGVGGARSLVLAAAGQTRTSGSRPHLALTGGRKTEADGLAAAVSHTSAGFRFVPLGHVGRASPTVPVLGSQVRATQTAAHSVR